MVRRNNSVLMFVENFFPSDIRVRREAESLTENGYDVSVIALRKKHQKSHERLNGIKVYRIPEFVIFRNEPKLSNSIICKYLMQFRQIMKYGVEYIYFTTACFLVSLKIYSQKKFDVIHLHNPPDTLFIIAIFYRLLGKRCIFDHHDLSPELFSVKFKQKFGLIKKLLIGFEGLSCRLANVVICSNHSYKQIDMIRHGVHASKIFVVRNNPRIRPYSEVFNRHATNNPQKILYVGSINPQDGVDLLIESLEKLYYTINKKNLKCDIVGDGDSLEHITKLVKEKKLDQIIEFHGYIFERDKIFRFLSDADICVEPAPENELNRHSTFIKIMEYMSAGKPIVAFDLKENRFSAGSSAILIRNKDTDAFAFAIKRLLENENTRQQMGLAGRKRIESVLNWDSAAKNLIIAYESLP
jgi:glycosyltransferase involved in cell wall biosynthesis